MSLLVCYCARSSHKFNRLKHPLSISQFYKIEKEKAREREKEQKTAWTYTRRNDNELTQKQMIAQMGQNVKNPWTGDLGKRQMEVICTILAILEVWKYIKIKKYSNPPRNKIQLKIDLYTHTYTHINSRGL